MYFELYFINEPNDQFSDRLYQRILSWIPDNIHHDASRACGLICGTGTWSNGLKSQLKAFADHMWNEHGRLFYHFFPGRR